MEGLHYRPATADDEPALWELLVYAASMTEPLPEALRMAQGDAYLATYVRDFGRREGDLGVAAATAGSAVVGAAWLRLGQPTESTTHGVGTETEPELAIGLRPELRGRGVGGELLRRLLTAADARFAATVLSVRSTNPSVRLYERAGYATVRSVVNRVGGESLVMRRVRP